eukprot:GHUV01017087.1.p1 GENE.GHUV01017087.1~~GHUV01017087.1.p1  ORF type:complete len:240 (+),score=82.52 GHUV01017087.1:537-1256(+)
MQQAALESTCSNQIEASSRRVDSRVSMGHVLNLCMETTHSMTHLHTRSAAVLLWTCPVSVTELADAAPAVHVTCSLYESLVCNEYLADLPGPALLPQDPVERAKARLLIDQYGAKAGTAFGKLMFASEPGSAAGDLAAALKWAEGEASSEGPYFMGRDFTLVDAAIIPFFIRLRLLDRMGLFTMPEDLPKLQAWEAACLAHPAVSGSMQPPDSSKSYMDHMFETYQQYIAERKAAMAKQ